MSRSHIAIPSQSAIQGDFTAWLVCLSAGLFFLYEFFQLNVFDVIHRSLILEFNLNATKMSWLSSSYLWANIFFLLPAGLLLDRFSIRRVILLAMFVCVLGTAGLAMSQSFMFAFICHFLTGIGNAFCFLACVVLVSRWFPAKRQGLLIGCIVTMAFLGGMLAHTPLAYLNHVFGWRDALLMDASLGLLIFLWLTVVLQDYPEGDLSRELDVEATVSRPSLFQHKITRQALLCGFYTSCLNLPILVLCALWGAIYLEIKHHLSALSASGVVSFILMGSIIGAPLIGWYSDHLKKRKLLMYLGGLLTLGVFIILCLDYSFSAFSLSILFFFIGLFTSTQVLSYPLIVETHPEHEAATATAIASIIIMGGGALGQIIFGTLMGHEHSTEAFRIAMWMFPIMILLGVIGLYGVQESH